LYISPPIKKRQSEKRLIVINSNFKSRYPDAPKISDKHTNGTYEYPDRTSYFEALKFYCHENNLDFQKVLDEYEPALGGLTPS